MCCLKQKMCCYIIKRGLTVKFSNFIVKMMDKCKKGSWLWWRLAKLHFKFFDLSCVIFKCANSRS